MTGKKARIWEALVSLDSKTLLATVVNYYGAQFYSDSLVEFLADEGLTGPDDADNEEGV
jgi:hypothetical protein